MYNNLDKGIIDICHYEYEYFFKKCNVQGIGLGYKTINGYNTLEKVIQVYVDKKISKNLLSNEMLIPTSYKGIKTDVIETGKFTAEDDSSEVSTGLTSRVRPVTGGYSIGPDGIRTAATYGALVTDGERFYMLGNNHSLAQVNSLSLGHPILQPGVKDGGRVEYDIVARLSKFIPLKPEGPCHNDININYVDCAMAEVLNPLAVSSDIAFIGKITGIMKPTLGAEIQAVCRSSIYIAAKILAIGVSVRVKYKKIGVALFKDQFLIDMPSKPGDSGALITTLDRKAVGMLMSKAFSTVTCNNIQTVLDSLNVELVTNNDFKCAQI